MLRMMSVVALLGACSVDHGYEQRDLEVEPISPKKPGGGNAMYAVNGKILVGSHISKDGGETWAGIHPAIVAASAVVWSEEEIVVQTTQFGLGRWTMANDLVTSTNQPNGTGGVFGVRSTGTIITGTSSTNLARQPAGGTWSNVAVPPPPANPGGIPTLMSIASNANASIVLTAWGLYRSTDDGASWGFVAQPANAREVVALEDGRFLMFAADRSATVLDASGTPTTTVTPPWPSESTDVRKVACMGAVIYGDKLTRDLGATWEPLVPAGTPKQLQTSTYACGGDYLALQVVQPSRWTLKIDTLGSLGTPYAIEPATAFSSSSSAVVQAGDTFLSGDLAWKRGDAAWSIRIMPAGTIYALRDGSLFAPSPTAVARSTDAGLTWTTTPVTTPPPAADNFLSDSSGVLWASAGDMSSARLWRSADQGVTWTQVFDQRVTVANAMTTGMAPRLVAIGADDTFVATELANGLDISRDHGATWTQNPFPAAYRLVTVTNHGNALTVGKADDTNGTVWHLWHDHGDGSAFAQLVPTVNGEAVDVGTDGQRARIGADDHLYLFGGGFFEGVWRSKEPVD